VCANHAVLHRTSTCKCTLLRTHLGAHTHADIGSTSKNTRPLCAGSTEEEVTQVVSESIRERLTSGTQRPVAWDGVTQRGPELAAQVRSVPSWHFDA